MSCCRQFETVSETATGLAFFVNRQTVAGEGGFGV